MKTREPGLFHAFFLPEQEDYTAEKPNRVKFREPYVHPPRMVLNESGGAESNNLSNNSPALCSLTTGDLTGKEIRAGLSPQLCENIAVS